MSIKNYWYAKQEEAVAKTGQMIALSDAVLRLETISQELGECTGTVSESMTLVRLHNAYRDCVSLKAEVFAIYGDTIGESFCEDINYDDVVQTARALIKSSDVEDTSGEEGKHVRLDDQSFKSSVQEVFASQLQTLKSLHSDLQKQMQNHAYRGMLAQSTLITVVTIKAKLEVIEPLAELLQVPSEDRQELAVIAQSIAPMFR